MGDPLQTMDLLAQKAKLREDLLRMGMLAETAVDSAVMALVELSPDLAREVVDGDKKMNLLEILIDKECLDLLRCFRLDGDDLRFVTAAMKINNDLERIGDLAVDIAGHASEIRKGLTGRLRELTAMVERVEKMIRKSVQTLVKMDAKLARKLREEDHRVDGTHDRLIKQLIKMMGAEPEIVPDAVGVIHVIRCLERIGDQVTNIAEEVIYLVDGEVVRHDLDNVGAGKG